MLPINIPLLLFFSSCCLARCRSNCTASTPALASPAGTWCAATLRIWGPRLSGRARAPPPAADCWTNYKVSRCICTAALKRQRPGCRSTRRCSTNQIYHPPLPPRVSVCPCSVPAALRDAAPSAAADPAEASGGAAEGPLPLSQHKVGQQPGLGLSPPRSRLQQVCDALHETPL